MLVVVALIFGIIIFFISYFSEACFIKNKKSRNQAKSFAAGVSIAYIFLELIPKSIPEQASQLFFSFILIGFILFHLLEKFIYQHAEGKKLRKELKEEHTLVFALYHLIVGIALVFFLSQGFLEGLFFFIPIILHDVLSSAAFRHVYTPIKERVAFRFILSAMAILGIGMGLFITFPESFFRAITGFLGGSLLHVVVRDVIPQRKEGAPLYFVLGVLAMIGFLSITFL